MPDRTTTGTARTRPKLHLKGWKTEYERATLRPVNETEDSRICRWPDAVFVALLATFVCVTWYNTLHHNPWTTYDYRRHRRSLRDNARISAISDWKPRKGDGQMESSPRLYYFLCGKASGLVQAATGKEFPHVYTVIVANMVYM